MHVHMSHKTTIREKTVIFYGDDVLQLLCLNSVIHGKQRVDFLQTEAATAALGCCW